MPQFTVVTMICNGLLTEKDISPETIKKTKAAMCPEKLEKKQNINKPNDETKAARIQDQQEAEAKARAKKIAAEVKTNTDKEAKENAEMIKKAAIAIEEELKIARQMKEDSANDMFYDEEIGNMGEVVHTAFSSF